ncbi:hypothetical protein MSUIS_00340 [Mycoplasma suis KI3806]|uniref:Uncharacterized protein n=1 Tax=Mycoplasma suis (strain KI_3806) TaxID=708248 RepID=F0V2Q5_MYCS3|nr:hypothetical protein [Mycoplasma suis]CBZ40127.1 hypothetical protein MSUIS_00340 [Mycoplasma suis KI3806]
MPFLGISSKILLSTVIGIVGSGVIAGAVVATSNNNVNISEQQTISLGKNQHSTFTVPEASKGQEVELIFREELSKGIDGTKNQEPLQEQLRVTEEKSRTPDQSLSQEISEKTQNTPKVEVQHENPENKRESSVPATQKVSKTKKPKVRDPELTPQERWSKEIVDRQITLDSLYIDGIGDGSSGVKSCVLVQKGETIEDEEEELNILEGRTKLGERYESCDGQTFWSSYKFDNSSGNGFWVRGEKELVKKLLKTNWDSLWQAGLTKNKEVSENENLLNGLNLENCKIEKNDGQWMEIGCSFGKEKVSG